MKKLKQLQGDNGKKLSASKDKVDPLAQIDYPVFCLRYLHKKYSLEKCDDREKVALITRMGRLSQMKWSEIQMADKHGFGTEKINQNAIKGAGIPIHLTTDEILYALRFDGKKPMVGYRSSFVFHVLYLDRDFTLYDH